MKRPCSTGRDTEILIYESARQLPASWDSLLPADHPLHTSQLQAYESIALGAVRYLYALAGTAEQPVAIACFQVLKVGKEHVNFSQMRGIRAGLISIMLQTLRPALLVAGHLFRHDITAFYAPELSNMDAYRVYESMISSCLRKSCAMAALIKDMPERLVEYFRNYAPHYGYLRNDISMQMDIPAQWHSFTDYEQALKHKYAQKLRKVRQQMANVVIRELSAVEVKEQEEDIYRLYRQVSGNQRVSLGLLSRDFIPVLKNAYDRQLKVWGFYEGGHMVAFVSAWVKEDTFDMFYIGFDYARNAALQLYFNILYFSIEQAILLRKGKLILGRTALEAKARLGCTPHYLHTLLLVRNSYLRGMVNMQLKQQYQQEGAWEERHPFRQ